ncbi:MAG: threonine/serine dehydratase [Acidobacteria bacterium]|nr:MAG: threonine/serine dehydratase [Acidobacteriota bacterium]
MKTTDPGIAEVLEAAERIAASVHRTPITTCATLDRLTGARLYFKCEHLQKVGAFKARGATNAVFSLSENEAARGVATHSSGNHAAALARAAGLRRIPAYIVMPSTAPPVKRAAVEGYGATITECEPTLEARETTLAEVQARTGATFIHPYDNPNVIAGQGTAALEFLTDVPDLQTIMAPVGGGGLLSGTAIAVSGLRPDVAVWGAEPSGADDAFRSLRDGTLYPSVRPKTIADGLLTSLSERTFRIIRTLTEGIVTAHEETIIRAMRLLWERAKLLVEPSAAVPLAAILDHPDQFTGRTVGIILSGGNVNLNDLPW